MRMTNKREQVARSILGQGRMRRRNSADATFDAKETRSLPPSLEGVATPREGDSRLARLAEEHRAEYKKEKIREQLLQDTINLLGDCSNKQTVEELKELIDLAKERLIRYQAK
jgi:hypothetical protein